MSRDIECNVWKPYTRYEKHECDIKLKDGKIIKHVYPNAGVFNKVCGGIGAFDESEVAEIMYRRYYTDELCNENCNEL